MAAVRVAIVGLFALTLAWKLLWFIPSDPICEKPLPGGRGSVWKFHCLPSRARQEAVFQAHFNFHDFRRSGICGRKSFRCDCREYNDMILFNL